jgi:thioredoxin-like negative regulator of GroEL
MSLLLDALKKAADDKKKASQDDAVRTDSDFSNAGTGLAESNAESSQTIQAQNHTAPAENLDDELSLELEEVKATDAELTAVAVDSDNYNSDDHKAETKPLIDNEASVADVQDKGKSGGAKSHSYKVSDDALSLLIHKTNREEKRSHRIMVLSALMISLAILVAGGVYYYMDMQAEIADLERKHQIAMQSMRLKTDKEKTPEKSEIIRTLVGGTDLDEKVRHVKKQQSEKKDMQQVPHKTVSQGTAENSPDDYNTGVLSIERTNKSDPVGDKLDAAWAAYENARYKDAKSLYKEVLKIESRNRDAYLGLGAIAIIEKDNAGARNMYLSLLEQDPRDPIAIAAIASLHSDVSTLQSDEKFLSSLLQKNPDASHLNFVLGNVYAQQGKWVAAQQSYFSAWQSDNDNADYIFNLAVSMDQLGKQQQAINFYKDSLLKSNDKQVSFSRDAARLRINELSGL